MEKENKDQEEKDQAQSKLSTPVAIIIAGALIMGGILLTNSGAKVASKDKTLSEQVGVNKEKFAQCVKDTDPQALREITNTSAESAMKGVPADQRGTPYIVIVGSNGSKAEVRGAQPIEEVRKLIAEVSAGKVTTKYTGEIPAVTADDHIIGSISAPITIVEYSDLECPFCKRFGGTAKQLVAESNGNVAWVYRHWVVHQGALPKAVAAECVAKLKGNDAFWKYVDLVFGLMKTEEDTSAASNL
ncbi:MAG: thioredoxin domain-containing protein [Candidatus Nomurabacteria bacterium]|nr:thioredoxin domain-containing protein [Candidatus Nomurabacteria bacterium]